MKKITVGLISHYFIDSNLGCVALSICNMLLLDRAAREMGIKIKYIILVNEKIAQVELDFINSEYEYRVYSSTKETIKHPIKLIKSNIFNDCDIVFNLCAGDGFTDIYGAWRTFSESYMTILGAKKGCTMVLAPQTIGPFNNLFCRSLAHYTMNRCKYIFARDNLSFELCQKMGQKDKTFEVVDVALALPYTKISLSTGYNLGINVSGLLYNNATNRFNLSFDYKKFINRIIEVALQREYNIHLISHVNIAEGVGEDDYMACKQVHDLYPSTILVPRFDSPIKAKSYISGLDLFTGARMHATIASISSGVPVIPIAYSRKFNGLYGNLNYPYFIDAKDPAMNLDKAVNRFADYLNQTDMLKQAVESSIVVYTKELNKYVNILKQILIEVR